MKYTISDKLKLFGCMALLAVAALSCPLSPANAQQGQRPNIVFIMGDDIGWANIGAYHRGLMASRTPNLDQLASQGMMFRTTMPRQVAQRAGQISLLEKYRSGQG